MFSCEWIFNFYQCNGGPEWKMNTQDSSKLNSMKETIEKLFLLESLFEMHDIPTDIYHYIFHSFFLIFFHPLCNLEFEGNYGYVCVENSFEIGNMYKKWSRERSGGKNNINNDNIQ